MVLLSTTGRMALIRIIFFSFLLIMTNSTVLLAQDLTAEQQQKLAAVESGLKRVQANFQLALESAGTGTPTGSRAKLSKMRLDTAAVDMPQLGQWLAELPAEQAQVKQLAGQYAATRQAITELDDRIAGKGAAPSKVDPDKLDINEWMKLERAGKIKY